MYSISWFRTFAEKGGTASASSEVAAVVGLAPPAEYPRLLDVGCGTGRAAGPLSRAGYEVYGIDTNVEALRLARRSAPRAHFLALDQRDVGSLRSAFDIAVVLWNSIGFADRATDQLTLRGLHMSLRPGARLLLDLYHPDWLRANERFEDLDERGASVTRWIENGRCFHRIRYASGVEDDIQFNVFRPEEIQVFLRRAGFAHDAYLVRWAEAEPSAEYARYQVVATREP